MKRVLNFSIIAVITGIVISTYSCSDDFYETPMGNRFDPEDHYKNIIDASNSYTGCLVFLQDIASNMVLVDGLRSDLMDITENANKDMVSIYNHNLSTDNKYLDPSDFYKVIINVNEVLPNLPAVMEKDRDFDSTMFYAYNGALTTLRVWSYFNLARLNGEVGLVDEDVSDFDPSKVPQYLTKKQIIDVLIEDLLPYDDEQDRFRYPIDHYALLGELYLEKGDYTNAVYYLKKCIDGEGAGDYMVARTYTESNWYTMFVSSYAQRGSLISVVPYTAQENQPNPLEQYANIDYMIKPSSTIMEFFETQVTKDGKVGDLYRGKGITYNISEDNKPYIQKYIIDEGFPQSADIIIYRPADIHLLLAEALNRNNQQQTALILLNWGMKQAATKPEGYTKWSPNNGVRGRVSLTQVTGGTVAEVEDLIMKERAMELAFEGKRFFDLVRIAERRNEPAYVANKVSKKFTNEQQRGIIWNKLNNPKNWYIPLSKIE